jgi:hypothetical protein
MSITIRSTRLIFSLLILLKTVISYSQTQTSAVYVSSDGKPGNTGTKNSPISLDALKDYIEKADGSADLTVYLRGGTYYLHESLTFISSMSDTVRQIHFTNYADEKVTIAGSKMLDVSKFKLVSDQQVLQRLDAGAKGRVYETDLQEQNVPDYGKRVQHGAHSISPAPLELFYNNASLTVARWPNSGFASIGMVLDHGSNPAKGEKDQRGAKFVFENDRLNRWKNARNAWLNGYFSYGYTDDNLQVDTIDPANKTIRVRQASGYAVFSTDDSSTGSLKNARAIRGFYIYNLLEELDTAGEWYLDEGTNKLYVWPPDNKISLAHIEVSMLNDPLVVLFNTRNFSFKGIEFAFSRGTGLQAQSTVNTSITNCTFDNLGIVAITTFNQYNNQIKKFLYPSSGKPNKPARSYNTNLLVQSCTIYNTGTGAIILEGGDRINLTAANNIIDNCEIYNFSRINTTYCPAISLTGVGNKITHCYIHDAPSQAILFYGNNHTISYNHFKHVTYYGTDIGAIYTGRDLSVAGNLVCYNFFDNIKSDRMDGSISSIYLDDGSSGTEVDNNIFYEACSSGTYHYGAVHINGGGNNVFRNNYFIDCKQAFSNSQWNDQQWRAFITNPANLSRFTPEVNIRSDIYMKRYPELAKMADSNSIAPRYNYTINTLAFNVGKFSVGSSFVDKNAFITNEDPGFADAPKANFTLIKYPEVLKAANDWKPIPFSQIGLRKNQ